MEDLKGMMVFARVVQAGSFAEAARQLGLGRAAVSHQIRLLEERLDIRLLHRSTRSLSLTHAGEDYYQSCRRILEEAEEARRRIQMLSEEPVGRISLTCSANFRLKQIVPLLSQFRHQHPKVELDVELTDEITDLVRGGYDIAIRSGPLADSDMRARKICSVARRICASRDYLDRHGRPTKPEDLAAHDWVTYSRHSGHLTLLREGRQYRIRITGPVRTNNAAARLEFVREGHGLGLLPDHEFSGPQGDMLERLLPDYDSGSLDLFAVYPEGATSTLKVRMLIDFLAKELAE